MRTALTIAALAALVVSGTTWASADTPVEPAESVARPTMVTITVQGDASAQSSTHTLRCRPNGGSHPTPHAACRRLRHVHDDVWKPVPPGTMCTMIYGGPETAQIAGTVHGKPVAAEFERTNGCEMARWDALVPVLPDVSG